MLSVTSQTISPQLDLWDRMDDHLSYFLVLIIKDSGDEQPIRWTDRHLPSWNRNQLNCMVSPLVKDSMSVKASCSWSHVKGERTRTNEQERTNKNERFSSFDNSRRKELWKKLVADNSKLQNVAWVYFEYIS